MEGEKHFYLYLFSLYHHTLLLSFILELCKNENPKIKYTKVELLNLRPKAHITKMGIDTCNHIKNLKIKGNFRRKRGGKKPFQRIWDNNNGIHQNLSWPLNRSEKTLWNLAKLNMALINIQWLKPKSDMLIHHMQLNNLDICSSQKHGHNMEMNLSTNI